MTPKEGNFGRKILSIAGWSVVVLILAVGTWYLFELGGPAAHPVTVVPTTESLAISTEATSEGPIAIPEQDAPTTPTPGFEDDFDSGLSAVWTVIFGDPVVKDGRLTSNIGAGIAAGDPFWENYQIDFDVDATQADCGFTDSSNSIGVRVQDFDHAYWFAFTSCNAVWSLLAGGADPENNGLFAGTRVDILNKAKHITIQVDEAKMSAFENGKLLSSITDSAYKTGGIFLQIEAGTFYDNFKATLLH